jgi:hypothetical protein
LVLGQRAWVVAGRAAKWHNGQGRFPARPLFDWIAEAKKLSHFVTSVHPVEAQQKRPRCRNQLKP